MRRVIAISPDGQYIAYLSGSDTQFGTPMIRKLDQLEARPAADVVAGEVFFSADSKWLGFFDGASNLKKTPVTGGQVVDVASDLGIAGSGSWGDDDMIAFTSLDPATGVLRVPASGGEFVVVSRPDTAGGELDHSQTAILPRARGILTTVVRQGAPDSSIAVVEPATGAHKVLLPGSTPEYVEVPTRSGPVGVLLFGLGGRIRGVRFDPDRLETIGEPVTLVEAVQTTRNGRLQFAVSRTGALVYIPAGAATAAVRPRVLVWVDRQGRTTPIPAPPRAYNLAVVSPDGRRAAIELLDEENDIWTLDFSTNLLTRLTFGPSLEQSPVWTPDSRYVLHTSLRESRVLNIYKQAADGTGTPERLTTSGDPAIPDVSDARRQRACRYGISHLAIGNCRVADDTNRSARQIARQVGRW